ncbi:hypothetical protein Q8F55_000001 [Vanrija albida]|uniref:Cytochrome b5 heme-binding domain-containing protein n=1 Tax=Vanrija albida TaxID=181172 RepID=A0ABR3QC25_9TREE
MNTLKPFTPTELAKLVDKRNLHLLIHGKVYAVHEFVHEHPGGDIVLLGEAGKDATKAWDDIEHSDEAKELMKRYLAESFPEPTELGKLSTQSDSKPQALLVFAVALVLAAALLAKML